MTFGGDIALSAIMVSKGLNHEKLKPKYQPDEGKCTHYSSLKHTCETCFKLHGYPEWWNDFQAKKKRESTSINEGTKRKVFANAKLYLSLIAKPESIIFSTNSNNQGNCKHSLATCQNHNDNN